MKIILLLLLSFFYCVISEAQYRGGINDGINSVLTTVNPLPNIYKGGINDGFNSALNTVNISPNIYKGGVNDGFNSTLLTANSSPNIYKGGINDGYSMNLSTVNLSPGIYTGGIGDGWSSFDKTINPTTNLYIFTGTGNWDVPSNWQDNLIPPSPLPAGYEIIINPSSGSCVLNVAQILYPGARISVANGKSFVVPGNIQ